MYGKLAMTCLKYQVYLYGSEQNQHYESSDCPHPPLQAALAPLCMAA